MMKGSTKSLKPAWKIAYRVVLLVFLEKELWIRIFFHGSAEAKEILLTDFRS